MTNETCRYWPCCDLLIAHQDQLDELVAAAVRQVDPSAEVSVFLVLSRPDRPAWQRAMDAALPHRDGSEEGAYATQ